MFFLAQVQESFEFMEALGSGLKRSASKASNANKSKTVVSQSVSESSADNGSSLKKIQKLTPNESDASNNADSKKTSSSAQNYNNNTLSRVILKNAKDKFKNESNNKSIKSDLQLKIKILTLKLKIKVSFKLRKLNPSFKNFNEKK